MPTTPHEAASMKEVLTGEYTRLSEQLEAISERKPSQWMEIKKTCKSSAEADRVWDSTPDGIQAMKLKMAMDRNEKQVSALNTLIRVAENEARNLY